MAGSNQIACLGQYEACAIRAFKLGADCAPQDTPGNVVVSSGIVQATLTPEVKAGVEIEATTACGGLAWVVRNHDRIKYWNLDLEIATWDYELLSLMVGGTLLTGDATVAAWEDKVVGWAAPGYNAARPNGVALELFSRVAYETGECPSGSISSPPAYIRHIFPKAVFQVQDRVFNESDPAYMKLQGRVVNNPALGPVLAGLADWVAAAELPADSAYAQVFTASLPAVGCGLKDVDITP